MALRRQVLHGIIRSVSSSSRIRATAQQVSSHLLLSPTPRHKINNQTTTTTNHMIFSNHHRQCHHLLHEDEDQDQDQVCEFDCSTGISHYSYFSDSDAEDAEPFDVDDSCYEDCVLESARFAVNFHNQEQNAQLQFVRVLKADSLPVGGSMLYITLEVNNAVKSDFYRTIVYYRAWQKRREVIAWEQVEAPPFPEKVTKCKTRVRMSFELSTSCTVPIFRCIRGKYIRLN